MTLISCLNRRKISTLRQRHFFCVVVFFLVVNYSYLPGHLEFQISKFKKLPTRKVTTATQLPISNRSSTYAEQRKESQKIIDVFNEIGRNPLFTDFNTFASKINKSNIEKHTTASILEYLQNVYKYIVNRKAVAKNQFSIPGMKNEVHSNAKLLTKYRKTPVVTLGTIACGSRTEEVRIMLKSAALFNQDAALHIVLFSDVNSTLDVAQDLLELKWTANFLGWDVTYEMHLDWFPDGENSTWRNMFTMCATQRLFFPSVLPHIDSLIYLDTDIIIVSNLTELWQKFHWKLVDKKLAALSQNNEPTIDGWYSWLTDLKIPYHGERGLNAAVMLMNLTKMREFKFQEKAIAANSLYREKIQLADQDIINIVFAGFPERLELLDCSFNFNWVHCGDEPYECFLNNGSNKCFCKAVAKDGVKIVHGNAGTFYSDYFRHLFIRDLYSAFLKLDLLVDSYLVFFEDLKKQFLGLEQSPCEPLTVDLLYQNAEEYLLAFD